MRARGGTLSPAQARIGECSPSAATTIRAVISPAVVVTPMTPLDGVAEQPRDSFALAHRGAGFVTHRVDEHRIEAGAAHAQPVPAPPRRRHGKGMLTRVSPRAAGR